MKQIFSDVIKIVVRYGQVDYAKTAEIAESAEIFLSLSNQIFTPPPPPPPPPPESTESAEIFKS